MATADDIKRLAANQQTLQRNFLSLKKAVENISERVSTLEHAEGIAPVRAPVRAEAQQAAPKPAKSVGKESTVSVENLGFKIFGAVGFILILLGLFFLYSYAVEQGWIGIIGRIALGILFSVAVLVIGEVFRHKDYAKFSQLLTGGGLALLYFTFYATYHFEAYRSALHMSYGVNTLLLTIVVIIAIFLSLVNDSKLLAAFAFFLGYLAAILAEVNHVTMIYTIVLSIGMIVVIQRTRWNLALYPVIASWLIYLLYFIDLNPLSGDPAQAIPGSVGAAWMYLVIVSVLYGTLTFLLDAEKTVQSSITSLLTSLCLFGFGFALVDYWWHGARALFALFMAVVYLGLAVLANAQGKKFLFNLLLVTCIVFLSIAPPIQLDLQWITVAWAVEGLLLLMLGLKMRSTTLRVLSYVVLGIAAIRSLFMDNFLDVGSRTFSTVVMVVATYVAAHLLVANRDELTPGEKAASTIFGIVGTIVLTVGLAVETLDPNGIFKGLSRDSLQVILSVAWALESIVLIVFGFVGKSRSLRIMGVILFIITILKILVIDLGELQMLARTVVTIVVGIIALSGAFAYIRNKDRIKQMLE